jgi:CheY-like chemotaxis protein
VASDNKERTVLIIDDDRDVRETLEDVLVSRGFTVMSAVHGQDAIRLLRDGAKRPDVILLDMLMPVMDGKTFRAEQQKLGELAQIPVIVVTAYVLPEAGELAPPPAAFLSKPFELEVLFQTLEDVMRPASVSS